MSRCPLQGTVVAWAGGLAARLTNPVNVLTSAILLGPFPIIQGVRYYKVSNEFDYGGSNLISRSIVGIPGLIFSCDQAALWMVQSVRLSVCPSVRLSVRLSVRHTFLTMFLSTYHHEIFRSYYQRQKWRPCKRWRSEVKGQGHRGHDPT